MPCLAKFLEVWIPNSVQSTVHRTFFTVLKTLGRKLRNVSLVGNITSSISLKILYINCMNVVNISRTAVPFIGYSGVLKRTDSVLMVKPVRSLRRQIHNFPLDDHLEIELVALLFVARSHFRFPLLV